MSFKDHSPQEYGLPDPALEERLRRSARSVTYPPTPNLAALERARISRRVLPFAQARRKPGRLFIPRWALATFVLLVVLLLAASPVGAQVLDWLQIGAVRIFFGQPTATNTPAAMLVPSGTSLPANTPTPSVSLLDLAGETTLASAAERASFDLKIPQMPPDIGLPQHVYYQEVDDTPVVIMVWLEVQDPEQVRMALYQVGAGMIFEKQFLREIEEARVNGEWALWAEGPYWLTTTGGELEQRRLVSGHTLIWIENERTYRLESDLSMEEAIKIAESLTPWIP